MTLITLIATLMMFNMPKLPYAHNALEPVISQSTIDFHYGKHLQTYVNNLNNLVPGTAFEGKTLEEIVATAPDGPVFNNAGQVLNHTFYFLQFAPSPARHEPEGPLADAIRRDFGSFDNFKKEFTAAATSLFGSGWAWLSRPTRMANCTSRRKPTAAIHSVRASRPCSPSTYGSMPTIWITRIVVPTIYKHCGVSSTGRQ